MLSPASRAFLMLRGQQLMWCAEEGGEAEEIREHTCCRHLGAGAWSSYDHRLSVVSRGLEAHDIVAATQTSERVVHRIPAHLRRQIAVTINRPHIPHYLTCFARAAQQLRYRLIV